MFGWKKKYFHLLEAYKALESTNYVLNEDNLSLRKEIGNLNEELSETHRQMIHEECVPDNRTPMTDTDALRMLSGASFGPNAKLILPSGAELNGDEAQAFTSLYRED